MKRWKLAMPLAVAAVAAACVTINVYFPEAAAEKVADRIIDDVWGPKKEDAGKEKQSRAGTLLLAVLGAMIPAAEAAEPDIDISSPEIQRLTASMEARHESLKKHYDSGAIGLTADGQVTLHDGNAVSLAERNKVRSLLEEDNKDRAALYREIATANGQPAWEADIRKVFAARWIVKARKGWWYQVAGGAWKQKG